MIDDSDTPGITSPDYVVLKWDIQLQTADRLRSIALLKQSLEEELHAINALTAALLRRAFSGEL
ncbi:MAG: hypothetical protein ACE5JN_14990 [Candidatus Methylomirabilia bacterium]